MRVYEHTRVMSCVVCVYLENDEQQQCTTVYCILNEKLFQLINLKGEEKLFVYFADR